MSLYASQKNHYSTPLICCKRANAAGNLWDFSAEEFHKKQHMQPVVWHPSWSCNKSVTTTTQAFGNTHQFNLFHDTPMLTCGATPDTDQYLLSEVLGELIGASPPQVDPVSNGNGGVSPAREGLIPTLRGHYYTGSLQSNKKTCPVRCRKTHCPCCEGSMITDN